MHRFLHHSGLGEEKATARCASTGLFIRTARLPSWDRSEGTQDAVDAATLEKRRALLVASFCILGCFPAIRGSEAELALFRSRFFFLLTLPCDLHPLIVQDTRAGLPAESNETRKTKHTVAVSSQPPFCGRIGWIS
mmetsp:Transcript_56/g.499  ORF Transcript_56/g.499 Transcript_56/m.499 type:complete len:136 (-) Transcript_56:598-1005(-)